MGAAAGCALELAPEPTDEEAAAATAGSFGDVARAMPASSMHGTTTSGSARRMMVHMSTFPIRSQTTSP